MTVAESAINRAVILLVEDDVADQRMVQRAFRASESPHDLRIVKDGEEAMDYLLHKGDFTEPDTSPRPALILLDLNLPRLDGRQVLGRIRQCEFLRRVPVVVLTTSKAETDIIKTYDLGVNSYIAKPLTAHHFMKMIQTLEDYWLETVMLPPR